MGIRETINRSDGHIYYVIDSEGKQKIVMGISFLDNYDQLDEVIGQPGLWFVRDAAADESGQHGDPSVHEGWAMYTWDGHLFTDHGGWRKVAEQESVDGPWGIDERILQMLVKKTEFNAAMASVTERLSNVENAMTLMEGRLNSIESELEGLISFKHTHTNKEVLDLITAKYGQMIFRGVPISGNCFFYNNIVEGHLYWTDPTRPDVATSYPVSNSQMIANNFCKTAMAWHGATLEVAEVDGSITKFDIVQDNSDIGVYHELVDDSQIISNRRYWKHFGGSYTEVDAETAKSLLHEPLPDTSVYFTEGKLKAVCASTASVNGLGSLIYVETLPADSLANDGRGMWCPTEDDGKHAPFHVYTSRGGYWVDITATEATLPITGASFELAFYQSDPNMPRKLVHLQWKEPLDQEYGGKPVRWGKTYLVRKIDSAPESIEDGVIVRTFTDREIGKQGIDDVDWYHNGKSYYRLFSESVAGTPYTVSDAVCPDYLKWEDFFRLIERGYASKMIEIGDEIVLPEHPVFGQIPCEVISVSNTGIKVVTRNVLALTTFGTSSNYSRSVLKAWLDENFTDYTKYKRTEDYRAVEGKTYYIFDHGYKTLAISAGEDMPEGVKVYEAETDEIARGIFKEIKIPGTLDAEYNNIPKDRHYNHQKITTDWWTRSAFGDKVVTGNQSFGVDPTETYGAIVVFTIARP